MRTPRILIEAHPRLRVMLLPSSGGSWIECGNGSYYGWRWFLGLGPLLLLIGCGRDDGAP